MQKKFAQKLNEHNEQTGELLDLVKELMDTSETQIKNGNTELAEHVANIAERLANIVGKITETFEEEHDEELELLKKMLANKQ